MGQNRSTYDRRLRTLALACGLGIAEEQAEVLMVLLDRRGEELTSSALCVMCNPHRRLKLNVFQERIRAIREVMGRDAIAGFTTAAQRVVRRGQSRALGNFSNTTYALSEEGLRVCNEAWRKVGHELIATSQSPPLRTHLSVAR